MNFHVTNHKDLPVLRFPSAADFKEWLNQNHQQETAVWLQFAKKASPHTTISYLEARDEALCWGWIDGQINKFDADFYLTKFCHRRPKSMWSQVNVGVVAKLIEEGRMTEFGLAEINKAKADGRWDAAYAPQSTAVIPDDLQQAIDANAKASAFFAMLKSAERYALIFRMSAVKHSETRARKITEYVAMLEKGEVPFLIPKKKEDSVS